MYYHLFLFLTYCAAVGLAAIHSGLGLTLCGETLTVVEQIAVGGYGEVYKVTDMTGAMFALKAIPTQGVRGKRVSEREVNQANIVIEAWNRHPSQYIVRHYCAEIQGEFAFIVMELVTGGDFESVRPVTELQTILYLRQLVSALYWIRQNRIVHRDLKPENILIDSRLRRLKIADFGLAVQQSKPGTLLSKVAGSGWYMAPEMLLGYKYDETVDLYSLGVILYEMLFNELPFNEVEIKAQKIAIRAYFTQHGCFIGRTTELKSTNLSDLLQHLLCRPSKRIGYNDFFSRIEQLKTELRGEF